MRPVTTTDIAAGARVLLRAPEAARPATARALIRQADDADIFRRATGRLHPCHGNGTLMSAALGHPQADPATPGDRQYLACLAEMLDSLLAWYAARNQA